LGIGVLAGLAAAVVAAPGTAQADTCAGASDPLTANVAQSERVLLCLTNIHRVQHGAGPVAMDPILQATARQYSEHLRSEVSQHGLLSFNHYGGYNYDDSRECRQGQPPYPSSTGGNDAWNRRAGCEFPWDRAQANGFPSNQVAENIAQGSLPTPQDVFQGFRNSPGHNAIMLDPDYVVAGMGISGGPYITELFSSTNTGATDTAVDLLITDECAAARDALGPIEQNVAAKQAKLNAAKQKLKKAKKKSRKKKRKARKAVKAAAQELKDAQNDLAAAQATVAAQCHPTSY
jgi:uncharacterized protein YkwD